MQKACIIIPCYNEENRLPVSEFKEFFDQSSDISYCFINDGSTDKTEKVLKDMALGKDERIKVLHLERNMGKAEAVRQGVIQCLDWKDFSYIGYFDADFSTPLPQINVLLDALEENPQAIMAFGARVKLLGRTIERKALRHYFGRIFSTLASIILDLPVYDTQCGAKVIKAEVAGELFAQKFISPWLFDVEIFARIRNKYGKQKCESIMIEVPLTRWVEKGNSRLKFKQLIKIPYELTRIFLSYRKENL